MNPLHPRAVRLRSSLRWLLAGGALLLSACAAPLSVPSALQPPAAQRLAHVLAAEGVQIYECKLGADGKTAAWTFVAPQAELYLLSGRHVGQHGAGPYWETVDGSRVTATVRSRADAPAAGAIPWLLLEASGTGHGFLRDVASIQRINTEGGVAPATGCDANAVGKQAHAPYRADYHFFRTTP